MKKLLVLVLFSFIFFNAFIPVILSDDVEIVIEYGTTTTIPVTTTTPSGTDGTPSSPGTTVPPEELIEGYSLAYSMPTSFNVYQNETGVFTITVTNMGTENLHNVVISISGIPENSYSINPTIVTELDSGVYTHFSVSVDPQGITPGEYSLTVGITSAEITETTSLTLSVKEYTRDVAEEVEDEEEVKRMEAGMNILKILSITAVIIVVVMVVVYYIRVKRAKEVLPTQEEVREQDINNRMGL